MAGGGETERITRKERIDPKLDGAGWRLRGSEARRTEEEPTANGPADYALWLDKNVVGVVEAKRVGVGPQGVLPEAERYARGLKGSPYDFNGFRAPFLYSTNGEVFWFHDVRHPLNCSRRVAGFHTPAALRELLGRDLDAAIAKLRSLPNDKNRLRPYQREANAAVEQAIADRKRNLLVAMATGTGKTFTLVNQIYRIIKSGVGKRVLFLVDRRALAAQAVRAFASFDVEVGQKFNHVYEVYSSKFQTEDFGDDEKFDPKLLPQRYLTDPRPGDAYVYVCTIQRMAIQILGRQATFTAGEEPIDEDAEKLDIPIHAFDVIVADECHRGYTAAEESVWRNTLDHFDAIKIGLTATPASHTTAYFTQKVFDYPYERAVREGHLVDYDVVNVRSNVRMEGVFLKQGENVEYVDAETGLSKRDRLEDERPFDATEVERRVTSPESNRKIVEEVKKYAGDHEAKYGRFPKTLFFAVNDLPHTSHADQLVDVARDVFGRGEAFVEKITGRVDRPLQKIREFRNRQNPGIAVTVDLLSTGVDIPDLEFIVFLRPVKSRILFEQILGRGTRKGEKYSDKDHFTVFDCFDGSLLAYFRKSTGITEEEPLPPSRTIEEIVKDIWDNRDRDYNVGCLVKRLLRIDKSMSGEARDDFKGFIPEGDLVRFAGGLPTALRTDFAGTMKLLKDRNFLNLLVAYKRPPRLFIKAYDHPDEVSSAMVPRDMAGKEYKPEDYLVAFERFVRENPDHIEAVRILLDRPRDWTAGALKELRDKLRMNPMRFTEDQLQLVHKIRYKKPLADIISMIKHAANAESPLLDAAERVEKAFAKVTMGQSFTPEQKTWLDRIRDHLRQNLSIEREDFELIPILTDAGGWGAVRRAFGEKKIDALIHDLNEAVAA